MLKLIFISDQILQDKLKTELLEEEEEGLLDQKISLAEDLGSCTNPLLLCSKIRYFHIFLFTLTLTLY